jgi:hypothetical protein
MQFTLRMKKISKFNKVRIETRFKHEIEEKIGKNLCAKAKKNQEL